MERNSYNNMIFHDKCINLWKKQEIEKKKSGVSVHLSGVSTNVVVLKTVSEDSLAYVVCIEKLLPIKKAKQIQLAVVTGGIQIVIPIEETQFKVGQTLIYFKLGSFIHKTD